MIVALLAAACAAGGLICYLETVRGFSSGRRIERRLRGVGPAAWRGKAVRL